MNRYSTPVGGFMIKKLLTYGLLFLWTVFWITQGYTNQKQFCNSKECCIMLSVAVVVIFYYYMVSLFSDQF